MVESKSLRHRALLGLSLLLLCTRAHAEETVLNRAAQIPPNVAFIRSFDFEGFVQRTNYAGAGAQTGRFRFRFRDPEVNAFVGMLVGIHHFNDEVRIGEDDKLATADFMGNWGGAFGIVRGKHLWELDLMGVNLNSRLGGALAFVGEHQLGQKWWLYHRTEFNIFESDVIMDADQGFYWMFKSNFGLTAGYRWMTALHMDQSGPHVGIRLYFESPKIPFVFPSLG